MIRQKLVAVFLFLAMAFPVLGQDAEKSYFEGLLQDALSSPQMQVDITGLQGTLSSNAKVEMLSFADPTGVWMQVEDAELIWSRSALLKRRVEIQQLSAKKITVFRLPMSDAKSTQVEASEFQIPQLPVSVNIDALSADVVDIKPDVIGQAAVFNVMGALSLIDGNVDVALEANHLDGSGQFDLDIGYSNDELSVGLNLQEEADGMIVTLLNIPNKPSVDLKVNGAGSRDAFSADIYLGTDGQERLAGNVIASPLDGNAEGIRLQTDLKGDLRPLFDAQYQQFFGSNAQLQATIERRANGVLRMTDMALETAKFKANGTVVLSPDTTPLRLDIQATIKDSTGEPIVLPISGAPTRINNARLLIDYTEGNPWIGEIDANGLTRDGLVIEAVSLRGTGNIAPAFLVKSDNDLLISSDINIAVDGISHKDADLARALGKGFNAEGNVTAVKGKPLQLSNVFVSNNNVKAALDGVVSGLETAFKFDGTLDASINDLSAFSGLVGTAIQGRTQVVTSGQVEILSGVFDLNLRGNGNGLAINNPIADRILRNENQFSVAVKRNVDGLFFDGLRLSNGQLTVRADGGASGATANVDIDARLNNAAVLSDALSGPMTLSGDIIRNGNIAVVDLQTTGVGGMNANIGGQIPMDGSEWGINATGAAPLALADSYVDTALATIRGTAQFDLQVRAPSITGVTGTVLTRDAQVILPSQKITLNGTSADFVLANGTARLNATGDVASGGTVGVTGGVNMSGTTLPANLDVIITDLVQSDGSFYTTVLNGAIKVEGPITGGALISGRLNLSETKVSLAANLPVVLSFLPDVEHRDAPAGVSVTRQRAGLVSQNTGTDVGAAQRYRLDILVDAPTKVFVSGRGVNAEFGGRLHLGGTTANVLPSGNFNLITGRMNLLGKPFSLTTGALSMTGSFDPRVQIEATTSSTDYETTIVVSGLVSDPKINFTSNPELPEEEVLAQLLFGKGVEKISPFQAFQLTSALRELSGQRAPGFIRKIKEKLSLDDFNVAVDEEGSANVSVGKYISERVYTDVTIAQDGKSEVIINFDLNKNVTLRGGVSLDGESSVGVFLEKDY